MSGAPEELKQWILLHHDPQYANQVFCVRKNFRTKKSPVIQVTRINFSAVLAGFITAKNMTFEQKIMTKATQTTRNVFIGQVY